MGVSEKWLVVKVATKSEIISRLDDFRWSQNAVDCLQREAQASDEIWFFDNGLLALKGAYRGYALVREGKPVAHVVTLVN